MTAPITARAIARDLGDLLLAGCGVGGAEADCFEQRRDFLSREALDLQLVEAFAGSLTLAYCAFSPPPRRFVIDHSGELAAVIEVLEIVDGERWRTDLVAWPVDRPSEFASAGGRANLLGGDQIDNPSSFFEGRPLRVHRHPLSWLRAGCRGVVVLDERRAGVRLAGALGNLAGEDEEHARQLARMTAGMLSPRRIVFPRTSASAA